VGVAVAVYRGTAGDPDPATAPNDRLVRAAVGAVAVTSYLPFWVGCAALLVAYLAAASMAARMAAGGVVAAFFP
ncbi:MAG TPA: hypothetical protein VM597_11700, partial [Gemmataceae bacterium]|nr:hypothetical protein [Gemmataceae bacterium]